MTHHANGKNRDARSKENVNWFRSASALPMNCAASVKATKAWDCDCGSELSALMYDRVSGGLSSGREHPSNRACSSIDRDR